MKDLPRITESEIELIKKAQTGDKSAFSRLFKRYKSFIDNVLFKYVKDMDEAKDLTNVVFLKVHDKLSTFTDFDSFGGWLRKIANNTAVDYLRRTKHTDVVTGNVEVRLASAESVASEEIDLVNRLTCENMLDCINALPKKTRVIMNLFYVDNLPISEISKRLQTPAGTIKSTLSRTRTIIKQQFKTEDV